MNYLYLLLYNDYYYTVVNDYLDNVIIVKYTTPV